MLVSTSRLFATTFKPEKPQVISSSSQLQKTTTTANLVNEDESIERAQFQDDKVHDATSITSSEPETKVITSSELRKQKKKDMAERILAKYCLGEKRVRSTRQFRKYVTAHEYPVIVLYRKKDSQQCQQVELSLKKMLIESKGKFRLCILDEDLIEEKLQHLMKFGVAPSIYMLYRGNIVQEHFGVPTRSQLKGFISTVLSFHYLATEEMIVNNLLKQGQHFIEEKKWSEAISTYEDAEKMERWAEIYGSQIYSSLSLAYAQVGNLTKAKHFMQLYRESTGDSGPSQQPEDEESQKINKASQIIMSHYTVEQQKILLSSSDQYQIDHDEVSSAKESGENDAAHILFSDIAFDAYYLSDEEEGTSASNLSFQTPEECAQRIQQAQKLIDNFDYQEGLNICLQALEHNYDNIEAHTLILETFNSLGFRNQVTLKTKEALKEILLKGNRKS